LRTRLILLLATALLALDHRCASARDGNQLGLDSLSFAGLQGLIASQDSVRIRGSFGEVIVLRPTMTSDSLLPKPRRARASA